MEETGREGVVHPPCSPELTPSNFYVFSHVKHCLRGVSVKAADELFLAIDALLRGIEKWTLHAAFLIGCRDPNILKPMVTILRELKRFRGRNPFYAVDVEMLIVR
jgi:hypothetical protein